MIARPFFERDPVTCARELVGCELRWGACAGLIVETEAYAVEGDEACHTFLRPSARAFVAAEPPGTAYVYLNYGVHWLLNVLIKSGAGDGFVLLRALEPNRGLSLMQKRRGLIEPTALCSGPGKLTQALAVDGRDHGRDLCASAGHAFHPAPAPTAVIADRRIGISKAREHPWRFLAADNRHISVPLKRSGRGSKA